MKYFTTESGLIGLIEPSDVNNVVIQRSVFMPKNPDEIIWVKFAGPNPAEGWIARFRRPKYPRKLKKKMKKEGTWPYLPLYSSGLNLLKTK